jgi:GNAT superfamily N-acetyltransferase
MTTARATRSAFSIHEPVSPSIPALLVRAARVDDHAAVAAVLLRSYQQYERHLPPGAMLRYLTDLVDIRLRAAVGEVLVVEAHDSPAILGTATFYPRAGDMGTGFPARWAGIRAMAVDPPARKRGVARQLMFDMIGRARRMGAPALALHTGGFMIGAVALYERLGFRRMASYDIVTEEGAKNPPAPAIAYVLDLT